jgi:valyl-tRNA synthetase
MPHDLPKAYDPTAIEDHWAEYWVRENLFAQPTPEPDAQIGDPFTILLPPPNVTGRLHMGHMLNQTEMDILTRWHRMKGDPTLWLPGTDHAGIATQMMVERQVTAEGTSRQALGREKFLERVWCWRKQYGGAILDQMKRLGASVDWQREYFTMDANLSVAVREAFVRLHEQGLIYRGAYVVNWCPSCQTAISDLEVIHEEVLGSLWEIRYPVAGSPGEFLTIATTRPETMLGDVAVAVHPEDERYLHLHGKKLLLPLTNREIPIVLDDWVSRDFGTGAVKVTPAHDPNDFALGQRHNLPSINIMDDTAHINEAGGVYAGLSRFAARKRVLEDLEALGLLGTIHDHKLSIGRCERSKDVIEPRLSTQWFIKIQPLADRAIQAVEDGHIQFTPEQYKKTYLNWMTNIHDWCISRQLWWGHRIPAWHCDACHKITVEREDPTACAHCGSAQITQETDVLDTWFSSGLLPVSVFGWPFADGKPSIDFSTFYPTSLLVTGFDILFFWVARMIMLGCWFALDVPMADGSKRELKDAVPFKDVYIHALVRDANREKMSKTKGNVIDPIEIVKQYGTDAVRFTLASMASPGTDIAFNVARTEGYRAFANKIWNAARFIFLNLARAKDAGITVSKNIEPHLGIPLNEWPLEDLWIRSRLNKTLVAINASLEKYRFDDAANALYQFVWGDFCDWYLEILKLRLEFNDREKIEIAENALANLRFTFEMSLRALSPFMPFITEELWQSLYDGKAPAKSIALAKYPIVDESYYSQMGTYENAEQSMQLLQRTITSLRTRRKELGVEEKALVRAKVSFTGITNRPLKVHKHVIEKLAKIEHLEILSSTGGEYAGLAWQADGPLDVFVEYERAVDVPAERDRLTKEIAKYEKGLASAERQLGNEGFLAKAPSNIVDGLKKQASETKLLLEKARAALDALPEA